MNPTPRELAVRWFEEVWNERREATIDELSSPQCVGHIEGKDGATITDFKVMRAALLGALPDLRITVEDAVGDERAAVVRWRADGAHTGHEMGLLPRGEAITFSGMTWLTFKDGRIVEAWDRWNRDGLLLQMSR